MKELTRNDIEKYLSEINKRLELENKYGEIIIAGGAALTVIYNARNSTHDIDAIFRPKEDLNKIIKNIAEEYNINKDWLNDGVKGFLTDKMTTTLYKEYSNLTVSSIDTDCLLALKLTSARAFSKDMDDSVTLMTCLNIKTENQLFDIIEKYISPDRQTPQSYFFTKEAFQQYTRKLDKVNSSIKEKTQTMSEWKGQIAEERKSIIKNSVAENKSVQKLVTNKDDR